MLLDHTCVNLRSNRITLTKPRLSDSQTEWKKTPLGFNLTFQRAYPLHYQS
jgi:hypothetical protein